MYWSFTFYKWNTDIGRQRAKFSIVFSVEKLQDSFEEMLCIHILEMWEEL